MMTYDTHAYFKKLVAKGVPEEQAEVHAEELQTLVVSQLTGKSDLAETENRINANTDRKILDAKVEIIKWVVGVFLANSALMFSLFKFFD